MIMKLSLSLFMVILPATNLWSLIDHRYKLWLVNVVNELQNKKYIEYRTCNLRNRNSRVYHLTNTTVQWTM